VTPDHKRNAEESNPAESTLALRNHGHLWANARTQQFLQAWLLPLAYCGYAYLVEIGRNIENTHLQWVLCICSLLVKYMAMSLPPTIVVLIWCSAKN